MIPIIIKNQTQANYGHISMVGFLNANNKQKQKLKQEVF